MKRRRLPGRERVRVRPLFEVTGASGNAASRRASFNFTIHRLAHSKWRRDDRRSIGARGLSELGRWCAHSSRLRTSPLRRDSSLDHSVFSFTQRRLCVFPARHVTANGRRSRVSSHVLPSRRSAQQRAGNWLVRNEDIAPKCGAMSERIADLSELGSLNRTAPSRDATRPEF